MIHCLVHHGSQFSNFLGWRFSIVGLMIHWCVLLHSGHKLANLHKDFHWSPMQSFRLTCFLCSQQKSLDFTPHQLRKPQMLLWTPHKLDYLPHSLANEFSYINDPLVIHSDSQGPVEQRLMCWTIQTAHHPSNACNGPHVTIRQTHPPDDVTPAKKSYKKEVGETNNLPR